MEAYDIFYNPTTIFAITANKHAQKQTNDYTAFVLSFISSTSLNKFCWQDVVHLYSILKNNFCRTYVISVFTLRDVCLSCWYYYYYSYLMAIFPGASESAISLLGPLPLLLLEEKLWE